MSAWLQAEDFVLSANTHVTGVRFWTIEASGVFDGSFAWSILSNAGGSPGTVLASGVSSATRTAQGSGCCGLNRFQNDIGVNVNLLAGTTYWLSLHNGPLSNTSYASVYWETTNGNAISTGLEQSMGSSGWSGNGQEHAFALSSDASVPEPGTWVLLSSGIAAVCLFRRRAA
jgi:PEP-CTERM motif-containing protein